MFARVGNIILAGCFLLLVIVPEDWHFPGSAPPHAPSPVTVREIVITSAICLWFLSAIGLFFRSRLMWLISLVGVGMASFVPAGTWILITKETIFPNETVAQHMSAHFLTASFLAFVMLTSFCATWFACSLKLFFNLLKQSGEMRWI